MEKRNIFKGGEDMNKEELLKEYNKTSEICDGCGDKTTMDTASVDIICSSCKEALEKIGADKYRSISK